MTQKTLLKLAWQSILNNKMRTVLIVTHEPDVAKYAKRIVEVRDGHIIRDHPVEDRRSAAEDLKVLLETEPDELPPLAAATMEVA